MNIVERVTNILVRPKDEWVAIEKEETSIKELLVGYLLILALIPAISNLIAYWFIGYRVAYVGTVSGGFGYGIRQAILGFVSPVVAAFVAAFIINALAEKFNSVKDSRRAMQLVVYSYTPGLIAGVFVLIPGLRFVSGLAALYGLYILYLGLVPIMKTPADKVTSYFVVSLIVMVLANLLIGALFAGILVASPGVYF